ncbi:nitronate monooxygenase family protein [Variovorax sp. KK3]|uniref:NAD(P)H-dependent flavin oxidoreductase n=1 Tax=Variovorax sp. KK3 TaxID=1855728 RepID=UPI0021180D49|nr:nitronate monooxygenase family protein [Variovorax sp. KK3]
MTQNAMCSMFNIEIPVFGFSHCRNVVAEITRAGGLGCLGTAYYTPEELEWELKWIDEQVGDKPYGVNLLLPQKYETVGETTLDPARLSPEHVKWQRELLDAAGIPQLPAAERDELMKAELGRLHMTPEFANELLDVALRHPNVKLVVSALGSPPRPILERLHAQGIKVGAMTGKVEHALKHKEAGLDLVIAQGTEAAGHTGVVSSMVLWPEVVDAVAPMPVLAAGGIGRGRQMVAAFALGAQGIWCGSIWHGTRESDLTDEMKQLLFKAKSGDAVQTRSKTGKPGRMLRSKYTEAWVQPDAPKPLPMPWQSVLNVEARLRIDRARALDYMTCPVGQIVGTINQESSVRQVIYDILAEFADTMEGMGERSGLV